MLEKIKTWWTNLPSVWNGINIKKGTTYAVLAFIVLFVLLLSKESDAAEPFIEVAPETTFVAGNSYTGSILMFGERFAGKYDVAIGLSTAGNCRDVVCSRGPSPTNQLIFAQRVVSYKKVEMGLGISYWHNQTAAWNSNTPFALSLGWNPSNRVALKWRHFSTGGSSDDNGGLDMITIGYKF